MTINILSQLIRTQATAQDLLPEILAPAGSFKFSLFYDCSHERASSPCHEARTISRQVFDGGDEWEAITKTGLDVTIKLEASGPCLGSLSIDFDH